MLRAGVRVKRPGSPWRGRPGTSSFRLSTFISGQVLALKVGNDKAQTGWVREGRNMQVIATFAGYAQASWNTCREATPALAS